ncbi:ankyrin repeat and SOCS box protein 1-like [Ostrea edulis]|uniref:ankyrin repeat and SOCS box protein 1-like n=1 Tax=Ostrea edulis TaxID=37623 RepID=UPI0024AEEF64|nr:ankyrin repeat and SOCS box protein 1-like [Ostrea edulis]
MNTDVCATPSIVQLAKDGDTEGVWKLLQKEEDVNARNFIGQTALHKAATAGNDDLVRVLIGVGAEVDSADRKCQTPLYSAVFNLHTSTSFLLLEKGANPEGNSKHLNTPLQIAIMHKNAAILKILLEYEANTAMTFSNGRVCAIDFLLSTTIDGRVCFDMMKSLLLHGCALDYNHVTLQRMTMSPLFACIFYLKPAAILVLLYEFGCQRWDFNWRDNRLYERREDREFVATYVTKKAGSPRSLLSTCRVYLYHVLQRKPLRYLNHLALPRTLKEYLLFSDLQYF